MHIITGLAVAALMGKYKRGGRRLLPRLSTGLVRTVHELPDRVRFRVPALVGKPAGTRDVLEERLAAIEGVRQVSTAAATGSILIEFDRLVVTSALLFAAVVRLMGYDRDVVESPSCVVGRELRAAGRSLNLAVYEKTGGLLDLRTAVLILIAGLGIRRLMSERALGLPQGFTLLWWSTNGLMRGGLKP